MLSERILFPQEYVLSHLPCERYVHARFELFLSKVSVIIGANLVYGTAGMFWTVFGTRDETFPRPLAVPNATAILGANRSESRREI